MYINQSAFSLFLFNINLLRTTNTDEGDDTKDSFYEAYERKVLGSWRRLHKEELHNLYTSPNIRVIKLRMRWKAM
jgi:hypothetical protein